MTPQAPKKQTYLLLDDHGGRAAQFKKRIANQDLIVQTFFEAVELRENKDDLTMLDGAIIDFHLETSQRPGYPYLRYPCTEKGCPDIHSDEFTKSQIEATRAEHDWHAASDIPEVNVTTGLGAMLYIKQHAPDVALFGFCELSAEHSFLFLNAAHLWLGASAINAEYGPDDVRKALASGTPEDFLPINRQLMAAEDAFSDLTDSLSFLDRQAEAFDWFDVYRSCGQQNTLAEFKRGLAKRFGIKTLESDVYTRAVCRWQSALARMLMAFNKNVSDWPDLRPVRTKLEQGHSDARYWDAHNPVLDFLKLADYHTFFTAADTRAALAYYRANQQRQRAEDPFGGF